MNKSNLLNILLAKELNVNPCDSFDPQIFIENGQSFIPWNKGIKNPYSAETCEKISQSNKNKKKWLGKKHSDNTKNKLKQIVLNRDHSYKNKQVITPDGKFNSLTEVAVFYDKSNSWVTKQLKNNTDKFKLL